MNRLSIIVIALVTGSLPSFTVAAASATLLTATELEGGAVETPARPFAGGSGTVNSAMLAASETDAQLKRVELFLKSGPAQNKDLRVVQSSKPNP